jgi:biotin carboxyl carrier protein
MKYITTVDNHEFTIELNPNNQILVNGEPYTLDFEQMADSGVYSLLLNNHSVQAMVEERDKVYEVQILGELYQVQVQDERAYRLAQARGSIADTHGEALVKSPMPGIILKVLVADGQAVTKGDKVIILESMKMENELRAPRDGLIHHVSVAAGASVEKGQVLVTIGD